MQASSTSAAHSERSNTKIKPEQPARYPAFWRYPEILVTARLYVLD
jgi:hypothetical protein